MPRSVPSGLQTHLEGTALTTSLIVRIERSDGEILGFTDADRTIAYGGLDYLPADAIGVSTIETELGAGVGNLEVSGALRGGRIDQDDVERGLFLGAKATVRMVNRADLGAGAATLLAGRVGAIDLSDGAFRCEIRSLMELLRAEGGEVTSKNCTCRRLGDAQCKKSLAGNTVGGTPIQATKTVASVSGDQLTITFGSDSAPTGHYSAGIVAFTSGPNAGVEREVKSHTLSSGSAVLVLRTPFPFTVSAGQTAVLTAGCDRTFASCRDKFANASNFHGQADVPGNDTYVKAGR